jgi:hypothetical protein
LERAKKEAGTMGETLRKTVEERLGSVNDFEWDKAKAYAERKLELSIKREGNEGGYKTEPWYLAELIYETITQNRFSELTFQITRALKDDEENAIKKASPCHKDDGPTITLSPIVAGF